MYRKTFTTILSVFFSGISALLFAGETPSGARFEENKGQWPKQVRFRAEVPSGVLFLENKRLTWNMLDHSTEGHHGESDSHQQHHEVPTELKGHSFFMELIGASEKTKSETSGNFPGYSNYFIGKDASKWAANVKSSEKVKYSDVYKGINWIVYSSAKGIKYDFEVAPGADPLLIKMNYSGVTLKLKSGELILTTSIGEIHEEAPFAYQLVNGEKESIGCRFTLKDNEVSFDLSRYDHSLPLIIDPQLVFGSFSGSSADNWGFTATYDNAGNTYSAGIVFGIGYPTTTGAWQQTFGDGTGSRPCDIGIMKYSPTGQRLFATYLGGTGNEIPQSLIVSSANELFLFGSTGSADFPTSSTAWSRTFSGGTDISILGNGISFHSGTDMFICRFSEAGTQLLASTLVGGAGNDGINVAPQLKYNYADEARGGIAIDAMNNVYVGCSTSSTDFPVPGNSFQSTYGGGSQDGMVVKFNVNLTTLYWGTYLGGEDAEGIFHLTLDKHGNVIVAGGTVSTDFPVSASTFQSSNGGGQSDGFISSISSNGQNLRSSTYYGSDKYDQIYLLATDRNDQVYVYGQTEKSGNFFQNGFNYSQPNGKQFLSKFNQELTARTWATSFGNGLTKPDITPTAFTVDICGQIFVAGWGGSMNASSSGTFGGTTGMAVTSDAYQPQTDNNDFYLMVLDEPAQSLVYATYFGGATSNEHVDGGTSRFDRRGVMHQAVCAGCGGRDDFPTSDGVWSNINGSTGGCNNAVFKFDFQLPATVASFTAPPIACVPFTASFNNTSSNATTYTWKINGTVVSNEENPQQTFENPGLYIIQLIAENPNSCNVVDTFYSQIRIVNSTRDVFDSLSVCYLSAAQIGPQFPIDPYYQVIWTPLQGIYEPTAQSTLAAPEESTNYILHLSLGSCADTIEQYVAVRLDPVDSGNDIEVCRGQSIQIGSPGSTEEFIYQWSPADLLDSAFIPTPLASTNESTWFNLLRIPKDSSNGCPGKDSLYVHIPEGSPLASFETEIIASCTEVKVNVHNTSELASQSSWTFPNGSSNGAHDPQVTYSYGDTIYMSLIVSNPVCSDTLDFAQAMESLDQYFSINTSDAFSPNGDGVNDCFSPAMQNLPSPDDRNFLSCSTLRIYDRWGKLLFESVETANGCWDGFGPNGDKMPDGTYMFLFDGQGQKLQGTVSLLR